ncbi:unnamed protein product, partial [Ilex paraguariensis]
MAMLDAEHEDEFAAVVKKGCSGLDLVKATKLIVVDLAMVHETGVAAFELAVAGTDLALELGV